MPEYDDEDNAVIKGLRKQIADLEKSNQELSRQAAEGSRRAAFLEAGVDLTQPATRYFLNGYDGEITVDAIRKAAEEAGFLNEPTKPTGPSPEDQQQAKSFTEMNQALGTDPSTEDTTDHVAKLMALGEAAVKANVPPAEAFAKYLTEAGYPTTLDQQ